MHKPQGPHSKHTARPRQNLQEVSLPLCLWRHLHSWLHCTPLVWELLGWIVVKGLASNGVPASSQAVLARRLTRAPPKHLYLSSSYSTARSHTNYLRRVRPPLSSQITPWLSDLVELKSQGSRSATSPNYGQHNPGHLLCLSRRKGSTLCIKGSFRGLWEGTIVGWAERWGTSMRQELEERGLCWHKTKRQRADPPGTKDKSKYQSSHLGSFTICKELSPSLTTLYFQP